MKIIKKNIFLFLLMIIFFLGFIQEVSAVGMLGRNDFFIFEPGIKKTYTFGVLSNTDRPMNHTLGFNGDLEKYVTLSKTVLENLAPGEVGYFNLDLNLPDELPAGLHTLTICALESETRGGGEDKGTSIGTRAAICLVIKVLSLYPEKLAEFDLSAPDVASGEIAEITMQVRSLTQQNMSIKGIVDIYSNSSGSPIKVISLNTEEKILYSGKNEELSARLDTTNLEIGQYLAKATLYFDENSSTQEKTFNIGNLSMQIENFTDTVYKNKVNKMEIYVKSRWNSMIKDVYSEVFITGNNQTIKTSSSTESFEPWQTKPLNVFLDAKNISAGDYNIKILLHYEGQTAEVNGKIKVIEKIELPSSTMFLIVIILVLVILFLILILRTRKKMRELEKKAKKKK